MLEECWQPRPEDIKAKLDKIIDDKVKKVLDNTENTREIMTTFSNDHHLVYRLFYPQERINEIEIAHNQARIMSANAGQMFDEIVKFILMATIPGKSTIVENEGGHPKSFEIDHLDETNKIGYEVKWRDAGTDGDHKNKEFRKVDMMKYMGLTPIRLTFFMPELERSKKAQNDIIRYYKEHGKAYTGDSAFDFLKEKTGVDLKQLLLAKTKKM